MELQLNQGPSKRQYNRRYLYLFKNQHIINSVTILSTLGDTEHLLFKDLEHLG